MQCWTSQWHGAGAGPSKFYIATRPQRVNELIEVFESSDGASWAINTTLSTSVIGPSAASVWDGPVNALAHAR